MSPTESKDERTCDWCDTAWVYVLGTLSAVEDDAYRAHLLDGCGICGAEIERARAAVADLDLAVHERGERGDPFPSKGVKARLRERLAASAESTEKSTEKRTPFSGIYEQEGAGEQLLPSSRPGVDLVLESEEGWVDASVPGVRFKTLIEDLERRYATALVRMEPGASYPGHRHAGREECYVISGDLSFDEHDLTAGDYQVAEAGSVHPVQSTKEGCLLLVVSSQDDVPLGD